jgi:hypothetical protein
MVSAGNFTADITHKGRYCRAITTLRKMNISGHDIAITTTYLPLSANNTPAASTQRGLVRRGLV